MKTGFLYLLLMTAPNGESYVMDSGLSESDCRAVASAESWSGYFDGAQVIPVPSGAAFTCQLDGQDA